MLLQSKYEWEKIHIYIFINDDFEESRGEKVAPRYIQLSERRKFFFFLFRFSLCCCCFDLWWINRKSTFFALTSESEISMCVHWYEHIMWANFLKLYKINLSASIQLLEKLIFKNSTETFREFFLFITAHCEQLKAVLNFHLKKMLTGYLLSENNKKKIYIWSRLTVCRLCFYWTHC